MDSRDNTSLSEATFFIMLSLSAQPEHGYAIMRDVQVLSGNRVILSTGTLYGAIKRLLADNWIQRVEMPDQDNGRRERKYYALTPRGRRILSTEVLRLRGLVDIAGHRLAEWTQRGQD